MHFYFLFYRDFHGFQARYNFYKHFSEEYKQILQLNKCKIFFISNVFRIKVSLLIITTIFSGIGICFSAKCQHKIQGSAFRLSDGCRIRFRWFAQCLKFSGWCNCGNAPVYHWRKSFRDKVHKACGIRLPSHWAWPH